MSKPDEKAIERDFCAGVLSQQDVADKYGITFKALRYMAKKNGWVRKKLTAAEKKKLGANKGQKAGAKKRKFAPIKLPQKMPLTPISHTMNGHQIQRKKNSPILSTN